jgi:hypothetical protein
VASDPAPVALLDPVRPMFAGGSLPRAGEGRREQCGEPEGGGKGRRRGGRRGWRRAGACEIAKRTRERRESGRGGGARGLKKADKWVRELVVCMVYEI